MITQEVILKEIDDGCYGKCNDKARNTLIENIKTLEDLGSLNEINEYEVDKAFLDKMKYIKEHKNETDNLVYTDGLAFFKILKSTLEIRFSRDLMELDGLKETVKKLDDTLTDPHVWENADEAHKLQKQSDDTKAEIKEIEDRFKVERDKFIEVYEVPKAPDIEIPEAVLKNLDANDVYILYDDTSSFSGYIVYSSDCANRIYDTDGNLRGDRLEDIDALRTALHDNKKFYLDKYNILYLAQE